MKPHALLTTANSLQQLSLPRRQTRTRGAHNKHAPSSPALTFLNGTRRNRSTLLLPSNPSIKATESVRFDGPVVNVEEDCEVVVETCVTKTLPPAVTLEGGLESIKAAVERLKSNPPSQASGVYRFRVAVPPGPKALRWFCRLPESTGVFPRFFISKETENPSVKSLYLSDTRGVFGVGAAIYFKGSSCVLGEHSLIKRYLSSESIPVSAYGFMDMDLNTESCSIKHEAGSFYFLIPEIELDEHDGLSILTATVAWNDYFPYPFQQAIQSFESSIHQATCYLWSTIERCYSGCMRSALKKVYCTEDTACQMVSVDAALSGKRNYSADSLQLMTTYFHQFCFRLSQTVGVSSNVVDHASEISSFKDHANINGVWASLIVEECCRLGLMYFCVAPGSRSSPLAIAASTHPLTTCMVCFDERSLAFHAVGYSKGSHKPAVVITSSGTAVSNLYPAVVEASQEFVPLLLLTADRPPELQDVGANQAINQVNHFGSFMKFFFSLPPPTDDIPARMVLTTLDSAVHLATSTPYGPVHINCPFREPLDDSAKKWMPSSLNGLDKWISCTEPFTKYLKVHNHDVNSGVQGDLAQVFNIIVGIRRGLLLIAAMHSEDEIWAALLLAKHLNWPVVADILSGLRLRKLLPSFPELEESVSFLDHFDHILVSDSVLNLVAFDVIIQIGSRITSKRISKLLEECYPSSYILVDNHPYRYDPSHLVTHRIQCSIVQFAEAMLKAESVGESEEGHSFLKALNRMVAEDVSFQISVENSLTEPYVMRMLSEMLSSECALFVGNSMVIRDADMYGCNRENSSHDVAKMVLNFKVPCLGIWSCGNRGASGIDGLLSTAVGFAVGSKKRVLCVLGDVSFLHDTNGLAILSERVPRKPMTIVVINNHGGAIFSLLPIAARTDPRILNQYFYTLHDISIQKLCVAHGVRHLQVKTKSELQDAFRESQHKKVDCVIEVESSIDANSTFHSILRKSSGQAADHTLSILSSLTLPDSTPNGLVVGTIQNMDYSKYRIQLCAPPTSNYPDRSREFYREGYIVCLSLEDGTVGYGEVAPLDIHKENLKDVEEQLRFLTHVIQGTTISYILPLLKGSLTSWMQNQLGIPECSVYPSVRCGLEMAILNAMAARQDSDILNLLQTSKPSVKICALIDSTGSPAEVARIACSLVEEGFTAIKIKVARRADPSQDAEVVREVRRRLGYKIELRADANRRWTYEQAIKFATLAKDCGLQYIEEPLQNEVDILRYCEESGLPVALDETVDNYQEDPLSLLKKFNHARIVALVIKPSVVGGFEKAALIAQCAQRHGKMAVISAAFESGLSLSAYILFSSYLEMQNADLCRVMNYEQGSTIAHGLGTYRWLKQDVATKPLGICYDPVIDSVGASVAEAFQFMKEFRINQDVIRTMYKEEQVHEYTRDVHLNNISCSIKMYDVGHKNDDNAVLFLHGFLGTGEDWIPIMKGISGSARCISIDLPGHGRSKLWHCGNKEAALSVETVADIVCILIQDVTPEKLTLVGYSMGARIALHIALRLNDKINGAVIISGSPGLKDITERKIRLALDDSRACLLVANGLKHFLDTWYAGDLWKSLRSHPRFKAVAASRLLHDDGQSLAKVLSDLSIGRQEPLWEDLMRCNIPLLLVVGEEDKKFKSIAQEMCSEISKAREGREGTGNDDLCSVVEVPCCGHAVHIENPLPLLRELRQFLNQLKKASS